MLREQRLNIHPAKYVIVFANRSTKKLMRLRTLTKWLAIALLVLAAGLAAFILAFDPNDHRERIEATASNLLGRAVTIEGPMGLGISLYPTVVIEGVRVANPDWASRQDLLRVSTVEVRFSLIPLFAGRVEIPNVLVDKVDLLLEEGPDGATNWSFLALAETRSARVDSGPTIAVLPDVLLLSVRDSTVAYRPVGSDAEHEVVLAQVEAVLGAHEPIQLSAQGRVRDVPFTAEFTGGSVDELVAPAAPWPVEVDLSVAGASMRATGTVSEPLGAPAVDLHVQVEGEQLDRFNALVGWDLPPLGPYGLESRVSVVQHELNATGLKVWLGGTEFTGTVGVSFQDPRTHLRVTLSAEFVNEKDFTVGDGASKTLPSLIALGAFELPVEILREMDMELNMSSEKVVLRRVPIGAGSLAVRVEGGLFQMDLSRDNLFGGDLRSRFQLDVRGQEPVATFDTRVESVDFGRALEAFGVTERIRGKTNLALRFEGQGATIGKVLDRGSFRLRAGPSEIIHHDPKAGDSVLMELNKIAASVAGGEHIAFAVDGRFRGKPLAVTLRGGTLRSLFEGQEPWPIKLSARAANASLAAKGHVGPWRDGVSYSLALGLKGGVITAIDPDLPAFGPYEVAASLDGGLDHIAISRLAARLGQTRISGALDVDLRGPRPRIQGSLVSPRLRLEDVVKTTKNPLPVAALRAFDVEVAIRAQRALVGPVDLADVTAGARLDQGVLRFSPIRSASSAPSARRGCRDSPTAGIVALQTAVVRVDQESVCGRPAVVSAVLGPHGHHRLH